MNEIKRKPTRFQDWIVVAKRKWPITLGVLVGVAIVAWALTGSDEGAEKSETPAEHAEADSVINLDSAAARLANIELITATPSTTSILVANGTITYDANHVSAVSPRTEGRILSVRADLGQTVSAGTVLALLESSEVGQTRGDLERARASVDVARRNYEREKRLFDQSITPQKELLEAEAAYRLAQADFNSAATKLRAVGAGGGQGAAFGLSSPINGTIVERNANPGQVVGPSTNLFTVAELRHVWITVDVYEADLSRVRQGAIVTAVPTSLPGETFPGRVSYAGGIVDPVSRTFKVRVELENPGLRLRPGMFAQVRIATPQTTSDSARITIPETSIQEVDGRQVVFVARSTPGQFIARTVTVGANAAGGLVAITSGLKSGERIVARGAFRLKSEMLKSSFGEDH
jgi:cobalt-zinc-cadmium efflux system membrane fusion protein